MIGIRIVPCKVTFRVSPEGAGIPSLSRDLEYLTHLPQILQLQYKPLGPEKGYHRWKSELYTQKTSFIFIVIEI